MQPIQPLELDEAGWLRFKPNKIVQYLLDHGGIDLNQLARVDFPQADREQFAQLIGYSFFGAGSLSYFTKAIWEAAKATHELGEDSWQVRARMLSEELDGLREALRAPIAKLYNVHEDDLGGS
jgi:hypothetical protein